MPIELLGAAALAGVGQEGAATAKAQVSREASASIPQDTTTLSANAKAVPSLVSEALSAAEARAVKVEALRQAVASATYSVDASLIADALVRAGV